MNKLFSDSDLDGVSCGIIGSIAFNKNINTTYTKPKSVNKELEKFITTEEYKKYGYVFITDLSISEKVAKMIDTVNQEYNNKFKVFDHHKTSIPIAEKYDWFTANITLNDKKTCGAELFWVYIRDDIWANLKDAFPDKFDMMIRSINQYIEYVRLYDTWDWTLDPNNIGNIAFRLNVLFGIYGGRVFNPLMIIRLTTTDITKTSLFTDSDRTVIDCAIIRNKRYIENKKNSTIIIDTNGMKVGFVFAEENVSELGNYLCKKLPEIDFAAIANVDTRIISLRTIKDNIDLSKIAEQYGGGGHQKAAGFVFDESLKQSIIKSLFN